MTFSNGLPKPVVFPILDGFNEITTTQAAEWSMRVSVTTQAATSWRIIEERISASVSCDFNTLHRTLKLSDSPFDWDIYERITLPNIPNLLNVIEDAQGNPLFDQLEERILDESQPYIPAVDWHVLTRKSVSHRETWDVRITEHTSKSTEWNTRFRVIKPAYTSDTWLNQVDQSLVHPIDSRNIPAAPKIQWNLSEKLKVTKAFRFNVRVPVSTRKQVTWNTDTLTVSKTLAIEWNTLERISNVYNSDLQDEAYGYILDQSGSFFLAELSSIVPTIVWSMTARPVVKKKIEWGTRSSLTTAKAAHWNARLLVAVELGNAIQDEKYLPILAESNDADEILQEAGPAGPSWNTGSLVTSRKTIRWRTLAEKHSTGSVSWNTLDRLTIRNWKLTSLSPGSLAVPVVHPVDVRNPAMMSLSGKGLSSPVDHPVDWSYTPSYNVIANPGIAWRVGINPSGRVVAEVAVEFNDLGQVVRLSPAIDWRLPLRMSLYQQTLFNTLFPEVTEAEINWIVGAWVRSHIRQTAQERIDFAY